MAVITIDGKRYEVQSGDNLLSVCLSHGIDLPYFCWHPAMGSVGACRQCAAKQFADDNDQRGRLVTACMTPVADGQIFSVNDHQTEQFRAMVIESLMTNHPHDCPVCEEGGECHLQDMTEMSGHTYRRYRGKKRTHRNQQLGPLINHEMNRCISCYRCVRFYRDYAGGNDLAAFASHNHVYFGREKDGVLQSEFAGNLVEVCPTGVFTDKPFSSHYSRKWDLQTAPSICTHCAVGCNTTPGARYGTVRRIVNRYHSEINGYFLCDRGRFGYAYHRHPQRIASSQKAGSTLDRMEVVKLLSDLSQQVAHGEAVMLGVGSARTSLENNYALREFVGSDCFYSGTTLADYEMHRLLTQQMVSGNLDLATIKQVEQADVIVVLGEDIADTAARVALAIRQAVRNKQKEISQDAGIALWQDDAVHRYGADVKTPLYLATLTTTRLDDIATGVCHTDPRAIARMGCYIAQRLDPDQAHAHHNDIALSQAQRQWAEAVIQDLQHARRPLIITGSNYQQLDLLRASLSVYSVVKRRQNNTLYYYAFPAANSLGLSLLLHSRPDIASASQQRSDAFSANNHNSHALQDMLDVFSVAGRRHQHRILVVLENDLYRSMDAFSVNELLDEVDLLLVLEHSENKTAVRAHTVIATSTALESQGTLVSSEGRAQRFYSVVPAQQNISPAWCYLRDAVKELAQSSHRSNWRTMADWLSCDDISVTLANVMPVFKRLPELNIADDGPLARQTHRHSGRTAMTANIAVAERKPAIDNDSAFVYSMEGLASHGAIENSIWSPGWNSNQAVHKFQQEVAGPLMQGESGIRLFEYQQQTVLPQFQIPLENIDPNHSSFLLFPLQHVFGSDELSLKSDPVAAMSPPRCVLINSKEAARLHVVEWDTVSVQAAHVSQQLYVRIDSAVPDGFAGVLQTGIDCMSNHWPLLAVIKKDNNALAKPVSLIATDGGGNNEY